VLEKELPAKRGGVRSPSTGESDVKKFLLHSKRIYSRSSLLYQNKGPPNKASSNLFLPSPPRGRGQEEALLDTSSWWSISVEVEDKFKVVILWNQLLEHIFLGQKRDGYERRNKIQRMFRVKKTSYAENSFKASSLGVNTS